MLVQVVAVLCATAVISVDVQPAISSDAKGMVDFHVPNGICFTTGNAQNQSAQSPQSIRGPKGEKGDNGAAGKDGTNGRDGRDGRDGLSGTPGSNASCSSVAAAGSNIEFALFETPGPSWSNLNRTEAPTISSGQYVGAVTFGMAKYYHNDITPQYVCRFENEDKQRIYTGYSRLAPNYPGSPYYNIGCKLPNATNWKVDKRRATVSVWFRNRTEIVFSGINGENVIVFNSNWTRFVYATATEDVFVYGNGLDPAKVYTAKFTWPNKTSITVMAKPTTFDEITFNLKNQSSNFVGKQLVTISISSDSGVLPYKGDVGGNTILLQEPVKHSACKSYVLLNEVWRKKTNPDQSSIKCDQSLRGWHRFDGSIGGQMPETCVPQLRCSTHASGWLDGKHPTSVGVEESYRVCFHWSSNCCNWNSQVKVVNCGGFYVYNFYQFPNACSLAYCGDA